MADGGYVGDIFQAMLKLEPGEWLLSKEEDGTLRADCPEANVRVEPVPFGAARVFHRVGLKFPGGRRVRWLVVEHGLTRIYIDREMWSITVSNRDLNP